MSDIKYKVGMRCTHRDFPGNVATIVETDGHRSALLEFDNRLQHNFQRHTQAVKPWHGYSAMTRYITLVSSHIPSKRNIVKKRITARMKIEEE